MAKIESNEILEHVVALKDGLLSAFEDVLKKQNDGAERFALKHGHKAPVHALSRGQLNSIATDYLAKNHSDEVMVNSVVEVAIAEWSKKHKVEA